VTVSKEGAKAPGRKKFNYDSKVTAKVTFTPAPAAGGTAKRGKWSSGSRSNRLAEAHLKVGDQEIIVDSAGATRKLPVAALVKKLHGAT